MGIIRQKLEKHIFKAGNQNELQAGFTADSRVTDNLYMFKYCINERFKDEKTLVVISLHFKKAFD